MSIEAMVWVFRLGGISPETGGRTDEYYTLTGPDKSVLIVLGNHADLRNECWPSISLICDAMAIKRRNVQVVLTRLENLGLIERIEMGGGRESTRYRLAVGSGFVTERSKLNDDRLARQNESRVARSTIMRQSEPVHPMHRSEADRRTTCTPPVHVVHPSGACGAPESLYNQDSITESDSVESLAPQRSVGTAAVPPAPQPAAPAAAPPLAPAVKPKREKSTPTRMTELWRPDFAEIEYAKQLGLDVEAVLLSFQAYWINVNGKAGLKPRWDLTWRVWCAKDAKAGQNLARAPQGTMRGPSRGMSPQDQKADWHRREQARRMGRAEPAGASPPAYDLEGTAEDLG